MSISIHPDLESKLRARAIAQGLTVEAYVERLIRVEQDSEDELIALAMEGLNSGMCAEPEAGYWEEKHRSLDEQLRQLRKTNNR